MRNSLVACALLLFLAVPASASEPLNVFVSILPQKYIAERIGGDRVEVSVMVPPGKSPATYAPLPKQMARLYRADVYFSIGVPFERGFLDKIREQIPDLHIVDTRLGITPRVMTEPHHHEGGKEGEEHDRHGALDASESGVDLATPVDPKEWIGKDPHIWLDPILVRRQALTIRDTLANLDPEEAVTYTKNYEAFAKDLMNLDKQIREMLEPYHGREIFVFHPSYGYFTDRYGLKQVPVEVDGKSPAARQLVELINKAKSAGVKVIFVQKQFSKEAAKSVADAIGGVVVEVDPLAEDYLTNLRMIALAIRDGLDPNAGKDRQ